MRTKIFLTAIALVSMTLLVSAQTDQKTVTSRQETNKGAAWVDANNNGVCDNFENGTNVGRSQGQRRMDGTGRKAGNGRRHLNGRGQGIHQGRGKGSGQGPAFVDENKNGVCDRRENNQK